MATYHANGLGESLGDGLVLADSPLYSDGSVWWVNSATGTDGASPAGKERLQPLATLAQAITNASAGDIIVLQDGHAETLTSTQTIGVNYLTIVGAGQSDGKPTVKFTNNQAAGSLFSVTAAGLFLSLRNIWFEEDAQACSAVRISIAGGADGVSIEGCYFEASETSNAAVLQLGDHSVVRNSSFVSTATDATDPPSKGIIPATASQRISFDGCTFDGGTAGWEEGFVYSEATTGDIQHRFDQCTFVRGADLELTSNSEGYVQSGSAGGHPRIEIVSPPGG